MSCSRGRLRRHPRPAGRGRRNARTRPGAAIELPPWALGSDISALRALPSRLTTHGDRQVTRWTWIARAQAETETAAYATKTVEDVGRGRMPAAQFGRRVSDQPLIGTRTQPLTTATLGRATLQSPRRVDVQGGSFSRDPRPHFDGPGPRRFRRSEVPAPDHLVQGLLSWGPAPSRLSSSPLIAAHGRERDVGRGTQ
jgi:hypothetical protein